MTEFEAPIRRKDTAKGHHYVDARGRRVPGVTTILDAGLPKKALINWAGNATAEAALNNWDALTKLPPAARLSKLKGARYEDKDTAAKRGTEVHYYAEQLANGKEVQVPNELVAHVEAYARFLDEWQVKPLLVEFSVGSATYGYAGSGDLIADLWHADQQEWVRWLLDVKTNRTGIYGETALQLAAYRYADELVDANGSAGPVPEVQATGAIHVRADGYSLHPIEAGPEQHRTFLYVQQVAEFDAVAKDMVGPPQRPALHSTYRLVREES